MENEKVIVECQECGEEFFITKDQSEEADILFCPFCGKEIPEEDCEEDDTGQ